MHLFSLPAFLHVVEMKPIFNWDELVVKFVWGLSSFCPGLFTLLVAYYCSCRDTWKEKEGRDFPISHNRSCPAMKPTKRTFPPWQPSLSKAPQGVRKQCLIINWVKRTTFSFIFKWSGERIIYAHLQLSEFWLFS